MSIMHWYSDQEGRSVIKSLIFNRSEDSWLLEHKVNILINLLNKWNSMSTYYGARLQVI
jgi:hypothetical protein